MAGRFCTERQLCFVFYTDNEAAIVTIQQPLSREVFWNIYAKIPRHTSKNAITEGDFKCILARNCEGTEQLPILNKIITQTPSDTFSVSGGIFLLGAHEKRRVTVF